MRKSSPRFTRLVLDNWRNFRHVEANLGHRVFLIGPNASGKSNFLDVFRFLHDVVSVGGGLQGAVRRRGGVTAIRCLAARQIPDVHVHVSIGDETNAWEYEISFNETKGRLRVKRERVVRNGQEVLLRPEEADRRDPERLTQTYLEQVNANREFRDIAEFFGSTRYLHIVPQLVREPDRSVGRHGDPFGGDFLEQVARVTDTTRKKRLKKIEDALRIAVPQLQTLELYRDVRGAPHLRGKYEHWRAKGAWQTEEQFSDGTLRLLGLLWAVLEGTGPLLLEEPELSLHPEVVRRIPSMIYRIHRRTGAQVLISTHSSDLLRDPGVGLDEVLLLVPGREGTAVQSPMSLDHVRILVEHGFDVADAVQPLTRPDRVEQLSFFGDETGGSA